MNLCHRPHARKPIKGISTRCRMETNNINKNTSDKTLHPERKTGFKPSKKLAEILIRPLQTCKRATLESRKGHSCIATVALLQARLGPFRPVFAPQHVSAKFKRLIIRTLEISQKSLICTRVIVRCKYRKQRSRKRTNSLTRFCPAVSFSQETHPGPPCREGVKDKG